MFIKTLSRIDRIFLTTFSVLILLIGVVILRGDRTFLEVKSFNLEGKTVSPRNVQLLFEFNREVDKDSVEKGLKIEPEIPGRLSFIGKKMAFTPSNQLAYSQEYTVTLANILDTTGKPMPRTRRFHFTTQNEQILYRGTSGDEAYRIVLYDMKTGSKKIVSPLDIYVLDFAPLHHAEKIIFSGIYSRDILNKSDSEQSIGEYIQLFELDVASGITKVTASNKGYYNYGFKISDDDTIALNRVLIPDKTQPGERPRLYIKKPQDDNFQKFWNSRMVGEPVYFAPDQTSILGIDSKSGFVINTILEGNTSQQLIGDYFNTYGFNSDGSKILFAKNDSGATGKAQSLLDHDKLLIYDQNGNITFIPHKEGILKSAKFSPKTNDVYFTLLEEDKEKPDNRVFNLLKYSYNTKIVTPLFQYPFVSVENFTISDDGKTILAEIYPENERTDRDLYDTMLPYFMSMKDFFKQRNDSYFLKINIETGEKIEISGIQGKDPLWTD